MSTKLFIAVDPANSKFAKALALELNEQGHKTLRCSSKRGDDHSRRGRKVFRITQNPLDKIQQLTRFKDNNVSCPLFTTNAGDLASWDVTTVFARTLVNSTGGKGIVEFERQGGMVPRAPLYTAYVPKKAEFRVHVFNQKVIDVQQKKKRSGFNADERNTRVRNLANGYVYTREGVVSPTGMHDLAIAAVAALGYQYGAVDIIYNERQDKCFVLEVNSRPGIMGTTLQKYVNAIKELV
jgi:hypothetical protein